MSPSPKKLHFSRDRLEALQRRLAEEGLATRAGDRIPRRAEEGPGPLSFSQERIWFLTRMAPGSPVFHIPAAYRVEGALDVATLEKALEDVVARHASLRTVFELVDGRPAQRAAEPTAPGLDVLDLTGVPADLREAEALERARSWSREPFDLETGPPVRFALLRLAETSHVFVVCVHHIVAEVQSLGILVRDLAAFYAARAAGGAASDARLPELPIRFSDFAAWQRERIQGESYDEQLAYWKRALGGELPALDLPTDRARPAVQGFDGGTRTRELPDGLARDLRALAREEGATLFTLALAAYAALLSRTTGATDVLVGAPVTDRNRPETTDLVGFFVNTVVLRCDLSGDPTFRELLGRTREAFLGAQSNQELPFEHLVGELAPGRDLSRSPIFQVAFLYQSDDESGAERLELAPGVTLAPLADPLAVHTGTSKFDQSLILWDAKGRLLASFEYASELFDAETIDRTLGHLERLLAGAVAQPDAPVSALPLLSDDERRTILHEWNATEAEIPGEACIHQLFEAAAAADPAALAVACGDERLSYGELDARANQLAHRLRALGVGPGELVGILTERAPEMIVGILATLKAGGAYVPLDLGYPKARLATMLRDARARVLLSRAPLAEHLPEHDGETILVDAAWPEIARESAEKPEETATSSDPAYVIYTSGSTGTPKGVALGHTGLVNLTTWHRRVYDVLPADRATHLAGLAFDASVWEVWPYLTAGASLHLVPDDVRLSPKEVLAWMAEHRITLSFLATPLAEACLREEMPEGLQLRAVLTGGDKLHRAPDRELPFELVNHYGPTENTVVATATPVPAAPDDESAPPIGRPIQNVRCYLLDAGGQPVPVGVPGELFIGGESLALGYHERPELTAEKFVTLRPGGDGAAAERLYATGDLARWRSDGQIEFLGRLDGQVKVRGFRIELGEIEAKLGGHEGVGDCAVALTGDAADPSLVAYTVPANGAPVSAEELRAYLRDSLPEYMVPAGFVSLDALPLTPNGKVDRRALPAPDLDALADEGFVPPEGELQEAIAAVWCEALDVPRVSADRNFFDLGGHSLLLASVQVALQEALGRELSIVTLFQYSTVASLAAHLEEESKESDALREGRDRAQERRARMRNRRARRTSEAR